VWKWEKKWIFSLQSQPFRAEKLCRAQKNQQNIRAAWHTFCYYEIAHSVVCLTFQGALK
jgi:hypothetical protein